MPRRALALALTLGAAPAAAAPADRWVSAGALAGDAALSDLARGQRGPALRQLEARLRAAEDPADRAALSCLIGAVLLADKQYTRAISVLDAVPDEAACAGRARFDAAEAAWAQGDQAGATARLQAASARALGPARELALAQRLAALADQQARPGARMGPEERQLRSLALSREAPIAELRPIAEATARRLMVLDPGVGPEARAALPHDALAALCAARLVEAWEQAPAPALLWLAAPLAAGGLADDLLPALGSGPADDWARAQLRLRVDLAQATLLMERAIAAAPPGPAAAAWRLEAAAWLRRAGELGRAQALLLPLVESTVVDDQRAALRALLIIEPALAPTPRAAAEAAALRRGALLALDPGSPERPALEQALRQDHLAAARARAAEVGAEALPAYDAILAEAPRGPARSAIAVEAAALALDRAPPAVAEARLAALLADGADPDFALRGLHQLRAARDGGEAALAWLDALAAAPGGAPAAALAADLRQPRLHLEAGRRPEDPPAGPLPARRATVRLRARGVDALSLRLHTIDPEALLRAGGQITDLEQLDVGVVRPDAEWAQALPGGQPGVERRLPLEVPVPGFGLYALTAATPTTEAKVLLLHGEAELLLRGVGEELLIGVLAGGQPARGAAVWVRTGAGVAEHRTGPDGLLRLVVPEGEAQVLAMTARGPALAEVAWPATAGEGAEVQLLAQTDRPAYLPGEPIELLLVGRRQPSSPRPGEPGRGPLRGEVEVWLQHDRSRFTSVRGTFGPDGGLALRLQLPTGLREVGVELWAQVEGEERPVVIGTVQVAPATPADGLVLDWAGGQPRVRDGLGRPVAGAPVRVRAVPRRAEAPSTAPDPSPVLWTGPDGRVALPASGALRLQAQLADAASSWLSAPGRAPDPAAAAPQIEAQLVGSDAADVHLRGPAGAYTLLVSVAAPAPTPAPAPEPPDLDPPEGFVAGAGWAGAQPEPEGPAAPLRLLRRLPLTLGPDGAVALDLRGLELADLPENSELVLSLVPELGVSADRSPALRLPLPPGPGARGPGLRLLHPAGAPLPAGGLVEAQLVGPALLSLEGVGAEGLRLLGAGPQRVALPLPAVDGALGLVATRPDGTAAAVEVEVQAALQVGLERGADGALELRVRDAAGRPTRARVALRAHDPRLPGRGLPTLHGLGGSPTGGGAGVGGALWSAAHAAPIAAGLLAEAEREVQAARAAAAARGELLDTPLADAFDGQEPILLGSIGTTGRGSGASGYGSGGGGFGSAGAVGSGRAGEPTRRSFPVARRARLLWVVAETDPDGRLRVPLPALDGLPEGVVVEALALSPAAMGWARLRLPAEAAPRLLVHGPGAAEPLLPGLAPYTPGAMGQLGPEDQLAPQVWAHNPSEAPRQLRLIGDGPPRELRLAPGEAVLVQTSPLRAGEERALRLEEEGRTLSTLLLSAAVAPPQHADPAGRLLRVRRSAAGGLPLWAVATEGPPAEELGPREGRAALVARGRALLAALPGLPEAEGALAAADLRQIAAALWGPPPHSRPGGAISVEELALAGGLAALPGGPPVARATLEAMAAAVERSVDGSGARAAALWAQAVAGLAVDEPALGRLLRESDQLLPAERARLGLCLHALGRPVPANLRGDSDLLSVLLEARLGSRGPALAYARAGAPLPPPGAPLRAEAVELLRLASADRALRPDRAPTVVLVNGVEQGVLDAGKTREVRLVLPPGAVVALRGGPALLERGAEVAPAAPAAPALWAERRAAGPLGGPLAAPLLEHRAREGRAPACGGPTQPCVLREGDALVVQVASGPLPLALPAGLRASAGGLRADQPGAWTLDGLWAPGPDGQPVPAAPLHLVALPADPASGAPAALPLERAAALALARAQAAVGQDPRPALSAWPAFDAWPAQERAQVMRLRWDASAGAGPAERVAAFEALRDAAPDAHLGLGEVQAVAAAYAEAGQLSRAWTVQRAALSAAFVAEAQPIREVEGQLGALLGLRLMRELAARSPALPAVVEAESLLSGELSRMADAGAPEELQREGLGAADLRLLAAAWDREFLALHPEAPERVQVGFQLARGLLALGAPAEAARWAAEVGQGDPADPALDALRFTEALARLELGQDHAAGAILRELRDGQWPLGDGYGGPSPLAHDAAYGLARLHEAAGRLDAAAEAYAEVGARFPEAAQAAALLRRTTLEASTPLLFSPGPDVRVPVQLANLDEVAITAYPLDLRTIFLRDGGLSGALTVPVAGVSPAWSARERVRAGPYVAEEELRLRLPGPGAWRLQLSGGGQETAALVVVSALQLSAEEGPAGLRVALRRDGGPAAGAELRAQGPGGLVAAKADARGVAVVPGGSQVFAWQGPHVAFSPLQQGGGGRPARGAPAPAAAPGLFQGLDQRLREQQQRNSTEYDAVFDEPAGGVDASAL
ncbi:MAG: hypothetical protein JNM72_23385 [Deltaproteobacteria bacterium]|nr:hypothetical protein [Deltaproteobacteria bacterium]